MSKTVHIVFAHPDPNSLTRQMADTAKEALEAEGHRVLTSDLYGMGWKAVYGPEDFPERLNPERLSFPRESGHARESGTQPADIAAEQEKLLAADALILQFPLWWFSMPAILKGWIDRVWAYGLAYGYQNAGNTHRYGEGGFAGRRALVSVTTGGPEADYGPRGINGPLDQLLFPLTHGALFYPGMEVLPLQAVYGSSRLTEESVEAAKAAMRARMKTLFTETPIAYRKQNGGDFPDRHTMADHIPPGLTGITAHIA
ncbi:NAD(P)H dehydrogenase (quinone) [Rhizomicrobium palustre]|uniref:NAD(P)H dehydrogenase (Quinone) n=1 Tax=Rhizomicrobium palustre TaxID=189966 RepID=A0A846MVB9_9PROT|nr:NAD(P)H-dependent oxidoreductase [Rhizomicrobium palustre]NIK87010.1 NAD(P)H dehydrogenase (quinone) [Rhizomicrobium palustre]